MRNLSPLSIDSGFDIDLDPSDSSLRLEAEAHLLERRVQDLEFRVDELEISNSLLRQNISAIQKSTGLSELHEQLRTLSDLERDLRLDADYSAWLLSEKTSDLAFLEQEISVISDFSISATDLSLLEAKISELESELEKQRKLLTFYEQTEKNSQNSYQQRLSVLPSPSLRSPSDNWEQEREITFRERDSAQAALEKARSLLTESQERLAALQASLWNDLGIDETEIQVALAAEIELCGNDSTRNLKSALDTEVEYRAELDRELREAKEGAAAVQRYHDEVIERNRQQYELAANRQRLRVLQDALDGVSTRRKG